MYFLRFCRIAGCGRTEAGVRGGRSFRKNGGDHGASQVQEKDQGQDTAEELQTGAEDFLDIKAFHLQEIEESLADLEEESSFRFADALKSLIRGEIPLNFSTLKTLVFDALLLEWKNQKETALQVFLLVIVAALVLNFTDLMEKNGTALISFFYDVSDAGKSSDEGIYRNEPDDGCNAWQSQWLYESSGAVLFCGGRFCGEQHWRAGVLRVGDPADRAVQWVQRYLLLPGVRLYVLFLPPTIF